MADANAIRTVTDAEILKALYDLKEVNRHGLKSGLKALDRQIGQIWRDGIVIHGLPDAGKSVLCLNLAVKFCFGGNRVVYFDLENDRRDNLMRIILITLAAIKGKDAAPTRGELMERPEILAEGANVEIMRQWLTPNFYLVDPPEGKLDGKAMDGWISEAASGLSGGSQVAFFLDSFKYLTEMYPLAGKTEENESRWLSVLVRLRKRRQIPIFVIPHRQKNITGTDSELMQYKGTAGISHFARTQIKLERETPTRIRAKVVRAQFGQKGEILFAFDQMRLLVTEMEQRESVLE